MDYQVNDISSFWSELMLPIALGLLTVFFLIKIVGKENIFSYINRVFSSNSNSYVFSKGLYVPERVTSKYLLLEKLKKACDALENRLALLLFVFIVLLFGLHRILLVIFPGSLVSIIPNNMFACGIDDYTIADMWCMLPEAQDITQVYRYLMAHTESDGALWILHSIEAYFKFFIFISIMLLIKRYRAKSNGIKKRALLSLLIVSILLASLYFIQIQYHNRDLELRFYQVYSQLLDQNIQVPQKNLDEYLRQVQGRKSMHASELYYGAYHLRSQGIEILYRIIQEFHRFISSQ